MVHVEDSIDIDAPIDEVFEYMDQPENQAEITPSLVESELVERLPSGGSRAKYTYSFVGVHLNGEVQATAYDPPHHITFEMGGDLEGKIDWTLEEANGGTRVTYAAEYDIPVPVLQSVAESFARRYNEREIETLLRNLKDRMEA